MVVIRTKNMIHDNFGLPKETIVNPYDNSNLELFDEFVGLPETKIKVLNPYKKLESYMKNAGARTRDAKQQKTRDRMKQRPVEVDWKDLKRIFEEKHNSKCFWFKIPINPMDIFEKHNQLAFSVDRINNNKGYTEDNIVICTRLANLGRGSCPFDKFKEITEKIDRVKLEYFLKNYQIKT